jgi:2-polyprenyl-6-methoxyphenol hydroxylase-like FAD-dependent oxidoreductase
MDADVIIVGAGPAGLMLAGELCLAGVRPLVLERQPRLRKIPKASGFNGQIVELLRYRGPAGPGRSGQRPSCRSRSWGPVRRCASGLLAPG